MEVSVALSPEADPTSVFVKICAGYDPARRRIPFISMGPYSAAMRDVVGAANRAAAYIGRGEKPRDVWADFFASHPRDTTPTFSADPTARPSSAEGCEPAAREGAAAPLISAGAALGFCASELPAPKGAGVAGR